MSASKIFVGPLAGSPVFDPVGDRVGRVRDVLVVYRNQAPPRVVGLIVEIPGRRRVFLSINRVTSMSSDQIITTGLINLRRFQQRGSEVRVIAELFGRHVHFHDGSGSATIMDAAITRLGETATWEIDQLLVRRNASRSSPFTRATSAYVSWREVREEQSTDHTESTERHVAAYSELRPADLALALLDLPTQERQEVARALPDERLADVVEELPEREQVVILAALGDARAADVLDHMQPDDAADLIGQLPAERRTQLLDLMEPEEARDVRFLLSYPPDSAGGLMTPEPIIVSAETTVAEALVLVRRHDLAPVLGAAVFVTLPPYEPPTGRFLGVVHFQRMLRHPPHERLGTLLDQGLDPVAAHTPAAEVSRILASYNLLSVPVVDDNRHLVGVVTVDDVLDYLLPDDWRTHSEGTR